MAVRTVAAPARVQVLHGRRERGEPLLAAAVRTVRRCSGLTAPDIWAVDLTRAAPLLAAEIPDERWRRLAHDLDDHAAFASTESAGAGSADTESAVSGSAGTAPHVGVGAGAPGRETGRGSAVVAGIPAVRVGFRPLTRADFPDVVRWQAEPHVARWWGEEARDVAAAERHYGPALDGADPTRLWVVEVNGRSVGMVQDYLIGDHPEFALLTAKPDAVGIDYLVGEPAWVGKGVGTRILWTYLRDVVRPHYPSATEAFAAPDHRNAASLRVLDKLGFVRGLWFDEPQPHGGVDTVVGCVLDLDAVFGPARDPGLSTEVTSG